MKQDTLPAYDFILAFNAMFVSYYKLMNYDAILQSRISGYSTLEIILSILGILLLLEATRRTVGLPIVIVAASAILYAMLGKYITTQILLHQGFFYYLIANIILLHTRGLYGTNIQH